MALPRCIRGKSDQGKRCVHNHDCQTNLLDLLIFDFKLKPGISHVGIDHVMSRIDIEQSWNASLTSGSILEA